MEIWSRTLVSSNDEPAHLIACGPTCQRHLELLEREGPMGSTVNAVTSDDRNPTCKAPIILAHDLVNGVKMQHTRRVGCNRTATLIRAQPQSEIR
jgi:hypothetical protein